MTIIGGMVLPRLYLTTYGSEVNGLLISINQFVAFFSYVEAGLGAALIYSLYQPLANKNLQEVNKLVTLAKKSYVKASGLYYMLVIGLSLFYPFIVKNESVDLLTVFLLVLVIGAFGALEFYTMAKYRVLLVADQKQYVLSVVLTLGYIVNFVLTVIMIRLNSYIVLVRLVPLVSFIVRSVLLSWYVRSHYPFVKYDQTEDTDTTKHLKRRWDALLMQLSVSMNTSTPVILLSIFSSLKIASVYGIYDLVFSGLIAIITIFTAGVSASFGHIVAKKETETLEKAHNQFEFFIFGICAFLYAAALILIDPFISIYTQGVHDIDYTNQLYGILFVIWGILFNARIPYTTLVNAGGLYRETRQVNIQQVLILLGLALILVQNYNIIGLLVALIVSALYWVTSLILVVKQTLLNISPLFTFRRIFRMFAIVFIAYVPFIFSWQIFAESFYEWFISALWVSVWCLFVTVSVNYLFDRKVLGESIERIKKLLPSKGV